MTNTSLDIGTTKPPLVDPIDQLIEAYRPNHGLAQAFYCDPAIFQRDMERIFYRHWHCLAHESVIPELNDFELFHLGDEQIILTRGQDGTVHALINVCRHRGAEVCTKERGNAKVFVCPYHAWTYANDGALRAARVMPKDFDRSALGLKKAHVQVVEGLVFVSFANVPLDFAPVAQAIEQSCGIYGWGAAKVAHRENYQIAANWKLAVENYVECYHCGPAHPEYSQTHALEQPPERIEALNEAMEARTRALGIAVGVGNHWQGSTEGQEAVDVFRYALYDGVSTGSADGSPLAPLMGQFGAFDGGATSVHIGGTSFLLCYADHGVIYRFIPKTVDSCEIEVIWLVNGTAVEGTDYDLENLTWLWKITTAQDKKIMEHTARGTRSQFYEPGPIAPMEYNELRYLEWYLGELQHIR